MPACDKCQAEFNNPEVLNSHHLTCVGTTQSSGVTLRMRDGCWTAAPLVNASQDTAAAASHQDDTVPTETNTTAEHKCGKCYRVFGTSRGLKKTNIAVRSKIRQGCHR